MYAKEKGFEAVIHQNNAHTKQILSLVPDKEYTIDTMLEKQPAKRTQTAPADAKPVVSDNRLGSPPATYSTEFSSAVKQIDSQQIQQRQTHIPGEKHIEQTNNDFLQQSDIQTDSSDNNKSSEMSLIPGVWLDPENNNNTRYSIKRINGEPRVVAAANNKEIFTVEKSLWSNSILTWEYLVPSTDFRLTYKTIDIKSDNVICSWSNDHGMSGTVVLKNMHQNFESDTIMAITKDTSRTGITTGKGIVKPLALNNTYKAYLPNGRTYVNFFSGGINIANMSAKYIDLIGQYYGAILYDLLGQQYTISPRNSYYFTWTFGAEFGLYPDNYIGINAGCFFMGKGDEVTLLKEGSERVVAEEHIYSMEIPLFFRLRVPNDELSPYVDAGVSLGIFLSAKEMVGYYNSEDASQNTDWSSVNLLNAQNADYYNHSDISFLFGIGLHFAGAMHVEYRLYYGLINFYSQSSTLDSKCITHSFTTGFDCYFKKKINKTKDINIKNSRLADGCNY
jgi:hypothetical protein